MMHLMAVQTLRFDTAPEYESAKPKIQRLADQAGAAVEWRDADNTAVLTATQELAEL